MNGIVAYGAYLPYFRLDRKAIGEALGAGGGKGTRVVASYDEDTTSMGVEAARAALRGAPALAPAAVYFATAEPAYLDKTNATAIHAALALDDSAIGVRHAGLDPLGRRAPCAPRWTRGGPTLAVLADIRTGLPGGADERDGGDGAAAFLLAAGDAATPVLAEPVGGGVGHRRVPRALAGAGRAGLAPVGGALRRARLRAARGGRRSRARSSRPASPAASSAAVIVAGPHGRANKRAAAAAGAKATALGDDLTGTVGNTGAAHAGLLLADALDRAQADDLIMVVSLADGCDVTIWRRPRRWPRAGSGCRWPQQVKAGGRSPTRRSSPGAASSSASRRVGPIRRRPRRRPAFRAEAWKFGFTGQPRARRAARGTCRPRACASSAARWTA